MSCGTLFVMLVALSAGPAGTLPIAGASRSTEAAHPRVTAPQLLYINFDGAVLQSGCGNDAHYDCSTLANIFDGYIGPYNGNLNQRLAIVQAARKAVADFGVRVVARRPPDDIDYTMVIYGDLGDQSFAGVAPYIDCDDLRPGDTSFTDAFAGSNTGSVVILQEAAHTWGLEHVDAEQDILNPFKSQGSQDFLDQCFPIVANTALEATAGSCNQVHTKFCEAGFQNSYQEMLLLFGPHIPDVSPPEFSLRYPEDGDVFVAPTSFAMRGDVDDNLHPQYYTVQIYRDDQLLQETTAAGVDFVISDPEPGEYNLRIVVIDEEGNASEDAVSFTVLPEGSELPPDPDEALDNNDSGQSCSLPARPSQRFGMFAALGVIGMLGRRRRRC